MSFSQWLLVCILTTIALNTQADETFKPYDLQYQADLSLSFEDSVLGGFERRKMSSQMKIRGWKVGKNTYFGQTRVDDRWGLGFVIDRGNTVYGLNHRGIQFLRKF